MGRGGINQINRKAIVKVSMSQGKTSKYSHRFNIPPCRLPAAVVKASDLWMINCKYWETCIKIYFVILNGQLQAWKSTEMQIFYVKGNQAQGQPYGKMRQRRQHILLGLHNTFGMTAVHLTIPQLLWKNGTVAKATFVITLFRNILSM